MKIAFVTTYDPHDRTIWAGSTWNMARALERSGVELEFLGPLAERGALVFKGMQFVQKRLFGRALHRDREPMILEGYARQVQERLERLRVDLVFSPGTVPIAHLQTSLPIVFWTDATYAAVNREYVWEPPAAARSLRNGHAMERQALSRASLAIYTSDWAAKSALDDYGADPKKVKVVPFGANIDVMRTRAQVDLLIDSRERNICRLLFIGVGWERKGGDIAVEVAKRLNARGLRTELSILGSVPPDSNLPEFIRPLGYIDKRTEEGRRRFDELFGSSHFLILPARAEAFGVVLCEACSFGVPCLAGRVGGIPTIVRDDVNGRTFARDCDPDEYAKYVIDRFSEFDSYRALGRSAFAEYESRLNWDVAAGQVHEMIQGLI